MWANAPGWLASAGEAVRGRLPLVVRDRVQGYPGAKVFVVSAAVGIAFVAAFTTAGGAIYRSFKAPDSRTAASATAKETASPAASAASNAPASPPAATAKPAAKSTDEADVLLDLADSLLAQHRDADVPSLVARLVAREPTLKDDERVKRVVVTAAASEDRRASGDAYSLLTGPMGEAGAALLYELSVDRSVREPLRTRAQSWLGSKDFERVAALPVYAAAKLRNAKTCEDKHALLDFAGTVGGKYVLAYLHELEGQTSCKPDDLVHCQPCMRNDSRLSDTIAKLERASH